MHEKKPFDRCLIDAIGVVRDFIHATTGKAPTDAEIADALKRYFVLNEIKDHILMLRKQERPQKP